MLVAQENLNNGTAFCSKTGVDQTAGGAKELWSNQLVPQKNTGQNCCLHKMPSFFFADSSFDQTFFAPPPALTTVFLASPAAWPLVLRKASNSNFGYKILKN